MPGEARRDDSESMNETTVLNPHLDHQEAPLSGELLARFRERAAAHDASGLYPHDNLAELRPSGAGGPTARITDL